MQGVILSEHSLDVIPLIDIPTELLQVKRKTILEWLYKEFVSSEIQDIVLYKKANSVIYNYIYDEIIESKKLDKLKIETLNTTTLEASVLLLGEIDFENPLIVIENNIIFEIDYNKLVEVWHSKNKPGVLSVVDRNDLDFFYGIHVFNPYILLNIDVDSKETVETFLLTLYKKDKLVKYPFSGYIKVVNDQKDFIELNEGVNV